ncbi:MAG TPA: dodecin domain-containing protein [Nitrososphaera sp.]|nr:dodecin domain-containing protein [Nitrososphaera sp.]
MQNIEKVPDMTAEVDGSGKIAKYKTTVKLSFEVEH